MRDKIANIWSKKKNKSNLNKSNSQFNQIKQIKVPLFSNNTNRNTSIATISKRQIANNAYLINHLKYFKLNKKMASDFFKRYLFSFKNSHLIKWRDKKRNKIYKLNNHENDFDYPYCMVRFLF